jgi:carbon monoxide dehydrogenase subunit G
VPFRTPSALLLAVVLIPLAEAADTDVSVSRDGSAYLVEASSVVRADRAVVWAVLTDYEGYVGFVPGLQRSHRASVDPLRIEQAGEFGILFFRRTLAATLEVEEQPMSRIVLRGVGGDWRKLETAVALEGEGTRQVVRYRSSIEPAFWIPPVIGTSIIRIAIRGKLQAVAKEIERRAGRQ